MLRILLWALVGGVLIALLKILEYRHLVHAYPSEIYGGLIAVLFTALGVYAGLRWRRAREVVVVQEVRVPVEEFELDEERLRELGLIPWGVSGVNESTNPAAEGEIRTKVG